MRAGEKGILALEVTVCVLFGLARCVFLNTKFKKYVLRLSPWASGVGQLKQIGRLGKGPVVLWPKEWFPSWAVAVQMPTCLSVVQIEKCPEELLAYARFLGIG